MMTISFLDIEDSNHSDCKKIRHPLNIISTVLNLAKSVKGLKFNIPYFILPSFSFQISVNALQKYKRKQLLMNIIMY